MPLYSHSRLGTYENCPFQYKLRYVDKVKPILGNTIESFMGRMVHDALEWLYKLARDSNIVSKKALVNKYDELWIEKWKDDIRVVKKELTADNFKETGKNCLEMYYERYHPFDQAITIGLEERMIIELPEDKKMQGYIVTHAGNEWSLCSSCSSSTITPCNRFASTTRFVYIQV